ncbi:hypothetical protein [Roseivirga sp.]|uniref:hypothetical protein n=1 Tax=Roseivirga sp. TaxID=1964215 RepID=UPI003B8AC75D
MLKLQRLRDVEFFSPLISFLEEKLFPKIENEDFFFKDSGDVFTISITPQGANYVPITFVFWIDELRLTVLIDNKEIFDDFLNSDEAVKNEMLFLNTLLSNKVVKTIFSRKEKEKKRSYEYSLFDKGSNSVVNDESISGLILPWVSLKEAKHIYDPWISSNE